MDEWTFQIERGDPKPAESSRGPGVYVSTRVREVREQRVKPTTLERLKSLFAHTQDLGDGTWLVHGPAATFRDVFTKHPCLSSTHLAPNYQAWTQDALRREAVGFMQLSPTHFLEYLELRFGERLENHVVNAGERAAFTEADARAAQVHTLCGAPNGDVVAFWRHVERFANAHLPDRRAADVYMTAHGNFDLLVHELGFQVLKGKHAVPSPPKGTVIADWAERHKLFLRGGSLTLVKRAWATGERAPDVDDDVPLDINAKVDAALCRPAHPGQCRLNLAGLMTLSYFTSSLPTFAATPEELAELQAVRQRDWEALRKKFLALDATDREHPCPLASSYLPAGLDKRFQILDVLAAAASGLTLRVHDLLRKEDQTMRISFGPRREFAVLEALEQRAQADDLAPQWITHFRVTSVEGGDVGYALFLFAPMMTTLATRMSCAHASRAEYLVRAARRARDLADAATRSSVGATSGSKTQDPEPAEPELRFATMINRVLRRLASAGVTHGNLYLSNFLLAHDAAPRALLVDFSNSSADVYAPNLNHAQVLYSVLASNSVGDLSLFLRETFRNIDLAPALRALLQRPKLTALNEVQDLLQREYMPAYIAAEEARFAPQTSEN
jgi:hypothetical protein